AIADLEAPDPARRPGIDVVDALLLQRRVPADIVVEVGVAAVDDRVARLEVLEELLDLRLGGVPGGDHPPDRPGLVQRGYELVDREERLGALTLALDLAGLLGRPVVDVDLVAVAHQTADHIGAHPSETDEAEAHVRQPSVMSRAPRRARARRRPARPRASRRGGRAGSAGRATPSPRSPRRPGRRSAGRRCTAIPGSAGPRRGR